MAIQPNIWVECLTQARQSELEACFRAGCSMPPVVLSEHSDRSVDNISSLSRASTCLSCSQTPSPSGIAAQSFAVISFGNSQASSPRTSTPPPRTIASGAFGARIGPPLAPSFLQTAPVQEKRWRAKVLGTAEVAGSSTCRLTRALRSRGDTHELIEPPAAQQYTALNCDLHRGPVR
jgi:hypothetical protein